MYEYHDILEMKEAAESCQTKPVERYGVQVYHDVDPDWCGCDFVIDPKDEAGLQIYREFCKNMAAHYQTLLK